MEAAPVAHFLGNEMANLADINNLGSIFFNIEIEGERNTNIVGVNVPFPVDGANNTRGFYSYAELAGAIEKSLNEVLASNGSDNEVKVALHGERNGNPRLSIINDMNAREAKVFRIYNKRDVGSTEALGLYGAQESKIKPETNAQLFGGPLQTDLAGNVTLDGRLSLLIDGEELSLDYNNDIVSRDSLAGVIETKINSSLKGSEKVKVTLDGNSLVFSSGLNGNRSEITILGDDSGNLLDQLGLTKGMSAVGTAPRTAEVTSFAIPDGGFTINDMNNQLQIIVDGEPVTAVITNATYGSQANYRDLAQELQNSINEATTKAADVRVTFDGTRFTIASTLQGSGSEIRIQTGSAGDASVTLGFAVEGSQVGKWDTGSNHDAALNLQLGANEGQTMGLNIGDTRAFALGLTVLGQAEGFSTVNNVTDGMSQITREKAIDFTDFENASKAITRIDRAINQIATERAKLGAMQNRLEHTVNNLQAFTENITASESRIRDADMALEMTNLTKNNIINQAATAMLAQANQLPQGILQLLQ
ncbi:hypothetical protein F9B85_03040 [Heliorestis acidaminivorans]|uniref:Flagellin C-terminal domain-containing protein n=2 Tax=Heliorestis acidaminivorans TaxID=553427 RepID=A0A6I0EWE1_9FIRM|nr:hypothetical protein F9B85_03040 [Heliorestis acidaminivorans]